MVVVLGSRLMIIYIFFFKQKTAYEMRISDWSSDVCSSDLQERLPRQRRRLVARQQVDELVAQREQAGRLQPHHGNPRLHIGPQRVERAPHLDTGLVDQTAREEGAAAAGWPRPAGHRGEMDPEIGRAHV